ncbi:hypothetical protein ACS0TY_026158 [Phlomoides rotata]
MANCKDEPIAVVMVPFPGQSHLNQLLHLAALISSSAVPVHFIGSATHNRQVKLRASGLKPEAISKITFHDFLTPPISTPDPSTAADKTPTHKAPAVQAYKNFRQPIAALVLQLSNESKRVVIIFDFYIADAIEDAVAIPNAECYAFHSSSAFFSFYTVWHALGKPFHVEEDINRLPCAYEFYPDLSRVITCEPDHVKLRKGDIYNTTRSLEGRYVDLLEREEMGGKQKQWAIRANYQQEKSKGHRCLEWLDRQAPRSVIYVCFGCTIAFSKEEAREVAMGLEQSKCKFVWVVLGADKADIFSGEAAGVELPLGFEEIVVQEDIGLVVRDWAPQLEILAHESVGGFMCHGGWNSCYEALTMGVPIAAWPMHSDHPVIALFVAEMLKAGLVVRDWARRDELVKASTISNVVGRLIASEEGDEMRKRAGEVSFAMSNKSIDGAAECCKDLENFIAHITR